MIVKIPGTKVALNPDRVLCVNDTTNEDGPSCSVWYGTNDDDYVAVRLSLDEVVRLLNGQCDAARTLADHGPDGHNVSNRQYIDLLSERNTLRAEAEELQRQVMEAKQLLRRVVETPGAFLGAILREDILEFAPSEVQ